MTNGGRELPSSGGVAAPMQDLTTLICAFVVDLFRSRAAL
jgi:hypothetical protein